MDLAEVVFSAPEIKVISVIRPSLLSSVDRSATSGVGGHCTLAHTNKNSTENKPRNFLQPVIDTVKAPRQLFVVARPLIDFILLDNARKTIMIYESCGRAR